MASEQKRFAHTSIHVLFSCSVLLTQELNDSTPGFPHIMNMSEKEPTDVAINLDAAILWATHQAGLSRGALVSAELDQVLFADGPNDNIAALSNEDLADLSEDARELLTALQAFIVEVHLAARSRLNDDLVTAHDVIRGLRQGDTVLNRTDNGEIPCVVTDLSVRQTMFGIQYTVNAAYLSLRENGKVSWFRTRMSMGEREKLSRKNAEVSLMDAAQQDHAAERGKKFLDLARAPRYAKCLGSLRVQRGWSVLELPLRGRVVVDPLGSSQTVPRVAGNDGAFGPDYLVADMLSKMPDCLGFFPQFAQGFSFQHKTWGLLSLDELHDIEFREKAFDQLVLDEAVKKTVHALVKHSDGSFSDVIEGKSGGSIFLLYGPPGAGKTLTAEAVAETLHRPLYVVNVGELGTTPAELEKALKAALNTAERWNAVVLLDEADIFLERRSSQDVVRNALVGIFLRELEYYRGVMFLTTNRASNLDPAILSRISMGIKYSALDETQRLQVWQNLAMAALNGQTPEFELDTFAELPLNGRQIKNVLRQALTLGKSQNTGLTRANLHLASSMTVQFMQDCKPKDFE